MTTSTHGSPLEPDLSMADVVRRLGVSEGTVRRWEKQGRIAAYRSPGGQRRFRAIDIEQLRAARGAERSTSSVKRFTKAAS